MKRARFVAPAREEFLAEVAYYEQVQTGPGGAFRYGCRRSDRASFGFSAQELDGNTNYSPRHH